MSSLKSIQDTWHASSDECPQHGKDNKVVAFLSMVPAYIGALSGLNYLEQGPWVLALLTTIPYCIAAVYQAKKVDRVQKALTYALSGLITFALSYFLFLVLLHTMVAILSPLVSFNLR